MGLAPKHVEFNWKHVVPPAGRYAYCSWGGFTLHAFPEGAWKVILDTTVIAHWEEQTTGQDLEDAKRRCQAAAIVHYQLLRGDSYLRSAR